MELYKAHSQWATRPDDERFDSLQSLHDACKAYAATAHEKKASFASLRVQADEGNVTLVGKGNVPARITHWAFGQLSNYVGAPASYLRELPATLACQNLNHGLAKRVTEATGNAVANLLFHLNGGILLRSITTDTYSRIWNWEVTERLLALQPEWEPARPDIRTIIKHKKDCPAGGDTTWGSSERPEGCTCPENLPLYASDHDMFAFLRNPNLTVAEKGSSGAVYKGIIVENSEVGASSLKLTRFLYREMCGNHIIWGASEVMDLRVRHVGQARERMGLFLAQVRKYAEESTSDLEAKIARAKTLVIADTKENVLDAIFGKRIPGMTKAAAESGYAAVKESEDGAANTVWGFAQGLTRYSQTIPYADKRTELDRAAGKLLEAF